ncbi:hypothetical protein P8625_13625 [Tenacibaculum tangerinum]|uniref:Knr4/Smi1-like domain-containing protein n=1 Tax=Tenacibaculum tangerinum TaxID=3038772 RepID=A0ABY8L0W6_9FLAO|nr:hypothetical protein [Tenacibaculum tangerinum]WGH75099.1 hypothetical protein P8625_13625 [Tenacibaculum tangerinum]
MNIEILTELREYPSRYPNDIENRHENQGLTIAEIETLEQAWNTGDRFPQALRELLFLAGTYCHILDYNIHENQQEMQEEIREAMQLRGDSFSRPFYIIDNYGGDQFLFVYLDEDQINPMVYEYGPGAPDRGRPLDRPLYSLSQLVHLGITAVKEGINPM